MKHIHPLSLFSTRYPYQAFLLSTHFPILFGFCVPTNYLLKISKNK